MRVRTSDAPCRCDEREKRVVHVRTADGGTRRVKICTRCGYTDSALSDAWQTRDFPEDATLPPGLLQSAASNEANRRMLETMTRHEIERLQQTVRELQQELDRADDAEQRAQVARALLQTRDALQFELETLAILTTGDIPDNSESGEEPQRTEGEQNEEVEEPASR